MRRTLSVMAIAAALALAACTGGASASPSSAPSAGTPTAAPNSEPPAESPPSGADPCAPSTGTGTVTASIVDFSFSPGTVQATVGDVITWTNTGSAPHTATLDDHPACDTGRLSSGDTGSIAFTDPGTYTFHCSVHSSMKGTIEVSAAAGTIDY